MYPFTEAARKNAKTPPTVAVKDITSLMESPTKEEVDLIKRAYSFAQEQHGDQLRYSGEPYFLHPFETAKYLAGLRASASMVAAGLLHDVIEDAGVEPKTLEEMFGPDVRSMVEGVTKLGHIRYNGLQRHAESLRKLFAATSQDVRVMLIKLMDRLHNARTLEFIPEHKRERIAIETLEIYAPIADRLGIGLLKRELEDGVFPHAFPKEYKRTQEIFNEIAGNDLKELNAMKNNVRKKIGEYGFSNFRTESRVKGLYSFYRKLQRKDWDVTKIYDIWALRIIVESVADCYTVLGIVHGEWRPMPGRFKDYIAFSKPNGYKSLHTTVHTGANRLIEIQIRTEDMHREAQFGIASHLSYKEAIADASTRGTGMDWIRQFIPKRLLLQKADRSEDEKAKKGKEKKSTSYSNKSEAPDWIRHMTELEEDIDSTAFLQDIKNDFFNHRVFVFTPTGDVIDLPIDSSPIDFAYAIHSDIGNHISGAKVNGKMASLDSSLHNGDIVEITNSDKARPTQKWIALAKTSLAKRHIRSYLQKEKEGESN